MQGIPVDLVKIITMAYRDRYERRMHRRNYNRNGGPIVGLVFLLVGGILISRAVGVPIPDFIISWQMLLITIGVFSGLASRFRNPGFIFPTLIGTIFLLRDYFPGMLPDAFILPSVLIFVGIFLIFKPRGWRRGWRENPGENLDSSAATTSIGETPPTEPSFQNTGNTNFFNSGTTDTSISDRLDETAVFGNIRKTLITKNFIGGEVSTVFGSAEINLLQADIQQSARLEINAVFGSIRLIVPTHWQVKMKTAAVLGGIEDKRPKHAIYSDKILVLEGNAVFGGIQIESH
jgi:hypothetical protein